MIKTLYLLRHGQSADKQPGQPDKERQLTLQGQADAVKIGNALKKLNINFDLVVSSTALRAKSTTLLVAEILALDLKKINWNDEIFEASLEKLLSLIGTLDKIYKSVLLVGHNPSISSVVVHFAGTKIRDLPPAGLAGIRFASTTWGSLSAGDGEMVELLDPMKLA